MNPNTNEVVLIDLSSIAYPTWHTSQNEPNPNFTSMKVVERVRALAEGHPHVAVCCDAGRSFRRDVSPDYKANRPEKDATLMHQIGLAIDQLAQDGFPIWVSPGFEADDVIASATAHALKVSRSVLIVSSDKDLLQLVTMPLTDGGPTVRVMSATNGTLMDAAAVGAKFGVRPGQMRDFLMLVGDASDNVKGARGIGPKKAAELLAKFDSIDALFERLETAGAAASGLTPAILASLKEFDAVRATTRQLIELRVDVVVPFDEVLAPRVAAAVEDFGGGFGDEDEDDGLDEAIAPLPATAEEPKASRLDWSAPAPVASVPAPIVEAPVSAPAPAVIAPSPEPPAVAVVPTATVSMPAATPATQETGLAVRPARAIQPTTTVTPAVVAPYERQLDPGSLKEAETLAKYMHQSALFAGYGSPQAVLSTIMLGRELGLPAIASLRGVHIIEGRHGLSAQMMVSLVLKSGLAEYFDPIEVSDTRAVFETQRKGARNPVRLTHTIEMAQQAQLVKPNSNWVKVPTDMLVARCTSRLCRLVYPDIIGGFYTPDELYEIRDARSERVA